MKVLVNAKVEYTYEVEVADEFTQVLYGFESYCDSADPVYECITKIMNSEGLDYEGTIMEIIDKETGKYLYEY